jgi:hypothetical protein
VHGTDLQNLKIEDPIVKPFFVVAIHAIAGLALGEIVPLHLMAVEVTPLAVAIMLQHF